MEVQQSIEERKRDLGFNVEERREIGAPNPIVEESGGESELI